MVRWFRRRAAHVCMKVPGPYVCGEYTSRSGLERRTGWAFAPARFSPHHMPAPESSIPGAPGSYPTPSTKMSHLAH